MTELESRTAEVVVLTDAMNHMLARLEQEQRSSTRRTVAAQESERQRIAQEVIRRPRLVAVHSHH